MNDEQWTLLTWALYCAIWKISHHAANSFESELHNCDADDLLGWTSGLKGMQHD